MEYHRSYSIQHFGKRTVMIEQYPVGRYIATMPERPVVAEGQTLEEVNRAVDAWYNSTYGSVAPERIHVKEGARYYANGLDSRQVEIREVEPGRFRAIAYEHRVIAEGSNSQEVHRLVNDWGAQYLASEAASEVA